LRIVAITFQPFAEKYLAAAFPIPDDVPVINIVLFIMFVINLLTKVDMKTRKPFDVKGQIVMQKSSSRAQKKFCMKPWSSMFSERSVDIFETNAGKSEIEI
jgi:hypothetical protein